MLEGSDRPLTEYRTYPIKYLNFSLFQVMQALDGHGHFGGDDLLLFDGDWETLAISRARPQIMPDWSLRINIIETDQ